MSTSARHIIFLQNITRLHNIRGIEKVSKKLYEYYVDCIGMS